MALKKTLLELVQSILSDMDSENVNSLSDTEEAQQIASVVEDTYYNIIVPRYVPEHDELIKLTALSDSSYPSHFSYPTNTKHIDKVWYENSEGFYREVSWCDPVDFLMRTDGLQSNYTSVLDKNAGTTLKIENNKHPTFYTSFDDQYLVFNSYESTVDSTLQSSKVRAYGSIYPTFSQTDSFVPDLDPVYFPYLLAESKSVCMDLFKGGSMPKVEQAARRQKAYIQNDRYNSTRPQNWPAYGRRP